MWFVKKALWGLGLNPGAEYSDEEEEDKGDYL